MISGEGGGIVVPEDLPSYQNGGDLDAQMNTLINEPFVLRIKDFFTIALEKIKHEPEKRSEFLNLCRTFDLQ